MYVFWLAFALWLTFVIFFFDTLKKLLSKATESTEQRSKFIKTPVPAEQDFVPIHERILEQERALQNNNDTLRSQLGTLSQSISVDVAAHREGAQKVSQAADSYQATTLELRLTTDKAQNLVTQSHQSGSVLKQTADKALEALLKTKDELAGYMIQLAEKDSAFKSATQSIDVLKNTIDGLTKNLGILQKDILTLTNTNDQQGQDIDKKNKIIFSLQTDVTNWKRVANAAKAQLAIFGEELDDPAQTSISGRSL